jgi:two-component system sensor histidine kinase QseC
MKLFTRYNRINIAATIITFLIGSIAFYFVLQYVLIRQLDQTLRVEQQEIVDHVKLHDQLPDIQNTRHQWIEIVPATVPVLKPVTQSVPSYDSAEKEHESIRQLIFSVTANKQLYHVTVNQSETETEDLLKLIILVTVCMIGFILISNYIINRRLVNRLWRPFYNTIDSIKDYHLTVQQPLQLAKEPIDEIELLNDSLNKMTQRIHKDYTALRAFTENASHEMQTPLAIIRSKVEALLQDAEGKEKNVQQLLAIEDATQKLARLHQSLLLLTKLENGQFIPNEAVDLTGIIQNKLDERQELINAKNLSITKQTENVILSFHRHLAEILVSNLLNNVIRYTPEGGNITVNLTKEFLSVTNTAAGDSLDENRIFQRFYKADPLLDGTGLGLAIIKEICSIAGFTIKYLYIGRAHHFIIYFKSQA